MEVQEETPVVEDASTSSTPSMTSPFKAAGVAALDAQARKDNEMRIDAIKAQNQLRGINSLDRTMDDLAGELDALNVDHVSAREKVYTTVMQEYPCSVGKAVSKKERDDSGRHQSTLVYGEITFQSFGEIFEKIKNNFGKPGVGASGPEGVLQRPGGTFYDLGSGTGKPVFAAAALFPFKRAVGVEVLEGLYTTSKEILNKWNDEGKPLLAKMQNAETEIDFVLGDITDLKSFDWTDGDILFANSTCFDDRLMGQIGTLAAGLKKGAIFITLTKRLPSTHFKVLESEMYTMSWGGATAWTQQKVTDPVTFSTTTAKPV